jgi:hypothetical protein
MVSAEVREQVRQRAGFACEYCRVTETDAAGELAIDHFRPRIEGGTDELDNLLYCCFRCNLYKADYWPGPGGGPGLWNPRIDARDVHLLTLMDGRLYPVTPTGEFTLRRLRLNRAPLIAHRLQQRVRGEEDRLLRRYRDLLGLLDELREQHTALLEEQRALLQEQRAWFRRLEAGGE